MPKKRPTRAKNQCRRLHCGHTRTLVEAQTRIRFEMAMAARTCRTAPRGAEGGKYRWKFCSRMKVGGRVCSLARVGVLGSEKQTSEHGKRLAGRLKATAFEPAKTSRLT